MAIYRRKPTTVDAQQFTDVAKPPRGVTIEPTPNAARTTHAAFVTTMQGQKVNVGIGEWIVAESDGVHFYPIADEEFRRIYEPV